jgi:hypothetical protein
MTAQERLLILLQREREQQMARWNVTTNVTRTLP